MQPMLNIAQDAARKAGNLILRSMDRLEHITVTEKSKNDFVTEIDQKAENEIIYHIRKTYPNHSILAEESGYQKGSDDEIRWIIDPIDGTANFMRGIPHFCISIAIERKGRIEHGLILDPIRDELFSASRGHGALLNNHRIRVTNTIKLDLACLSTEFPFHLPEKLDSYMDAFNHLAPRVSDMRRFGSAALDLAYVAAGRLDGYWEHFLHPWDAAAGALLVKEAGGYVTDFDGTDDFIKNGSIIAATPKIYPHIFKALKSGERP